MAGEVLTALVAPARLPASTAWISDVASSALTSGALASLQDTGKKTKADSSKNSGGCNNQANAMSATSANQEQAGSQSCD